MITSPTNKTFKFVNLSTYLKDVQEWYNGYVFGDNTTIYNPWSVVNFIDNATIPIGPQWLNTSSNALIHHELKAGGLKLKRDLELLLQGKELRYPITEHTIFEDIGTNPQNIWSFLCMSGYLNAVDVERDARARVPQAVGHITDRDTGCQRHRRGRVP